MGRSFQLLTAIGLLVSATVRAEVTLRWDSTGHVVAPTMVNGQGPFDFIFDTGADETAVYPWLVKKLNLPSAGSGEISGATGNSQTVLTHLSVLSVDGRSIQNVSALTLPSRSDGGELAGVVGAELMAGRLAIIDFGCNRLALKPLSALKRSIGSRSKLVTAGAISGGKQLTLPVAINQVTGLGILDSGNRATIINSKFASAANLPLSNSVAAAVRGATQKAVDSHMVSISKTEFAGVTREGASVRVADLPIFEEAGLSNKPAMILGLDLLKNTRIAVDFSARRFWVERSTCP